MRHSNTCRAARLSILNDRSDFAVSCEFVAAGEVAKFDEHGDTGNLGSQRFDEFAAGFHGAAGGKQVIDEDDALAGLYRVDMDFKLVSAVLEFVAHLRFTCGKLSGLADGHKASREGLGHGGAEDEAAGFGSGDEVYVLAPKRVDHKLDRECEAGGVSKQGREVAEHDTGFGEIRDITDEGAEVGNLAHGGFGERGEAGAA